jgi:transposase
VVRDGAVVQRVLNELKARQANGWEAQVIGAAGVADRNRRHHSQIDETRRLLTLWVRRKPGNRTLTCSHCGRRVHDIRTVYERKVRDLPCFEFQSAVVVE